jgi:tripartite-type tricarboxylate transporter receptor subunit TctC
MISLRRVLAFTTFSVCAIAAPIVAPALAQGPAWPTRTVRVITPQPPGTGIDISCRIFSEKLAQKWGQAVVVENRPGADGVTGVSAFVNANDDHTLLCSFGGPITISPFTAQSKLPYDPATDLKPIAVVADFVQIFAVSKTTGIDSIEALKKKAQADVGKLNWSATQGLPFMLFGSFLRSNQLEMAYVPYTVLGSALQDLGQGRIQAYATSYASIVPLLESNEAAILMVLNGTRAPQVPNVPTAKELGMPELTVVSFCGFFGPKDMPDAVRERMAAEIRVIGADPELTPRLQKMGSFARTSTPAEFAQLIEEQRKTVEAILKNSGGLKP